MKRRFARRSLRLRLVAYAAGIMVVTLVIAGFGLTELFSRNLERRIGQELDTHIAQLAGAIRFDAGGRPTLAREPADPRFNQIFGGLYWQIGDVTAGVTLRSRSLWDSELHLSADPLQPGVVHVASATGPDGAALLLHEQTILADAGKGDHRIRISVAIDRRELDQLRAGFARDIAPALVLVGLLLLTGFAVQISAGLRPLSEVRSGVAGIRAGRIRRLDDDVPSEVAPLVAEVNTLLDQQEAAMVRARDRAADLAHGLKTPLTALASDARKLREMGVGDVADDIDEVAARMRAHVERAIARARLRHGTATQSLPLEGPVAGIVRALQRTPDAGRVSIETDIPAGLAARIDKGDLSEIVGNLADNALRHAGSRVTISAAAGDGVTRIAIEDDGPGVDAAMRDEIVARGRRLDESTASGAGLGLAIVGDILDECGGRLELTASALGGLKAEVTLPA